MSKEVRQKVLEVLDSGMLTEGHVTREFEEICREYVGASHAIAVSSCTVGLEMALRVLKIGPGDEVIIPDFTFPATADVVRIVGASAVIVDVDPKTMLINYDAIEKEITKNTKAIMPVSMFGNPLDYKRLYQIKERYNLFIIEDAACSLGAEYDGRQTGSLADITVFSFHPRKFITTGEGGIIASNDQAYARWMRSYKAFGVNLKPEGDASLYTQIGTNYKLSNILAAIGLEQMKMVDSLLEKRQAIAHQYIELLAQNKKIALPQVTSLGKHSYQSFCIFVENRDEILKLMRIEGIEVQIGTYSLSDQSVFKDDKSCLFKGDLQGSHYASKHSLALPLYHEISPDLQTIVVDTLNKFLN